MSSDGLHYFVEKGYWATCLFCGAQVTLGGVTDKWKKVEKP